MPEDLEERLRRLGEQAREPPKPEKKKPEKKPFDIPEFLRNPSPLLTADRLEIPKFEPDEYKERKVTIIEEPVRVRIGYRTYSRRLGSFSSDKQEVIYVTIGGEEKSVYRLDKHYFLYMPEKSIANLVLSPDARRIAFQQAKGSYSVCSLSKPNITSICVLNIEGSNALNIDYGSLPFTFPKSGEDKDDSVASFAEGSLYSSQWVGNNILQFKGALHYCASTFPGTEPLSIKYWTHGPEQTVQVTLTKKNKVRTAKLVENGK